MNDKFYDSLEKSISKERLDHYSIIFETNDKKVVTQKYLLNIKLSKALYFPLQKFEITLRNNIHNILKTYLETDKWFEIDSFLTSESFNKINNAKKNITKELTSGRVVSELNFGFWCALFSKPYDQKIWNKYTKLIFPNIPKKYATRKILMNKINFIRRLRNKVFHFDTIIYIENLFEIYKELLEMIYWLNKDVYKNEEKIIKEKLNNLCRSANDL